jgi:peptidoglycan hydrolase-like protein with peptidoglycan-binding domain
VTYTTDTAKKGLGLLNLDEITRSEAFGAPIPGQDSPVVRPQGGVLVGDEVIGAVGHEPAQTGGEPDPTLMGLQQVGGVPPVAGEGTGVQSTAAGESQVKTGAEAVAEVVGGGAADEGVSVIDISQIVQLTGPRREYTDQAPNLQDIDLKSYKPFFDLASNFTNASRDSITGTGTFGAPAATETMAGAIPAGTTSAATTSPETNMTAQLQQAIESLRALPENSPGLTNAIDRIMVQYGIPRQTVKDMMYGKVPVTYPVVSADRLAVLEDEIGRARQRRGNEQANSIRFIANKHDIDVGLVKEMVYGGMPITPAVLGTGSVYIPEQGRVLRPGMSGNDVQNVQQLLVNAGYSVGSAGADGKFGQGTKDAVMRFQRDHGLKADGVVSSETWEELWRSDFRRRFKDQLAGVPGAGASATPGTIEAGAAAALSGDAKAPEPYTPEWFAMLTTPDFEIAPNRLKYMLDIRGLYPLDWNSISLKARMDALREAYPQGFTNVFEFDVGMALQNAYQALKHFSTDPTATVNFRALADAQAAAKQVYYRAVIETQGAVDQAYHNNLQIELERVKSMLRNAESDHEAELKKEQAAFQHELDVNLAGVNFDFNKYLENMRIAGQKDIARIYRQGSGGGGGGGSGGPTWAQQRDDVRAGITADMFSDVFPRFTNRKNMEASVREYGRWFVNNGLWSEDFYLSLLDANKTPNAMFSFGSKKAAKETVPGVGKVSDPLYLYAVELANKAELAPPKHRNQR